VRRDKEGFLRSERSLIQTAGRAHATSTGRVIFYADHITDRCGERWTKPTAARKIQLAYNEEHGIVPPASSNR
jgi:excinuclease ABC subunit B